MGSGRGREPGQRSQAAPRAPGPARCRCRRPHIRQERRPEPATAAANANNTSNAARPGASRPGARRRRLFSRTLRHRCFASGTTRQHVRRPERPLPPPAPAPPRTGPECPHPSASTAQTVLAPPTPAPTSERRSARASTYGPPGREGWELAGREGFGLVWVLSCAEGAGEPNSSIERGEEKGEWGRKGHIIPVNGGDRQTCPWLGLGIQHPRGKLSREVDSLWAPSLGKALRLILPASLCTQGRIPLPLPATGPRKDSTWIEKLPLLEFIQHIFMKGLLNASHCC